MWLYPYGIFHKDFGIERGKRKLAMWLTILRELGAVWNPYDYSGDEVNSDDEDDHGDPERMDKVPKEVIGCLHTKRIVHAAEVLECDPLKTATKMTRDRKVWLETVKPGSKRVTLKKSDTTRTMFFACLVIIATWTLLLPNIEHSKTRFWATFFTVPKSNGMLRTISDSRKLNQSSAAPPPTGLAGMSEILKKAAELGCTHHVQADISHWFHEIPLPEGIGQEFFGCKCKGKDGRIAYYHSRTWGMGFSFSPHVAQSCTLTMLLHKEPQEDALGIDYEEIKTWSRLPSFIEMKNAKGKVTGFLVCQYDNVGIFLTSGEEAVAWQRRLIRAQKYFNVHWKEIYKIDAAGAYDVLKREPVYVKDDKGEPVFVKDDATGVDTRQIKQSLTFLGAEMQVQTADRFFQWRHDEKKLAKWLKSFEGPHTTARRVAKVVGILIWDTIVSLTPLSGIADEIDVLKGASRSIKRKSDWDNELSEDVQKNVDKVLSPEKLEVHRTRLKANVWKSEEPEPNRRRIYLASDATETSIAGVMLGEDGRVISHFAKTDLVYTHIYIKEVVALYATVHWAHRILAYDGPTEFRIAVDSKSAAAACARCYSSNHSVNELLLRMWLFLKDNDIKLNIMDIHTKLNVADAPSRRVKITRQMAKATIDVLQERTPGRPDYLYEPKKGDRASEYLPLISEVEFPTNLADEAEETWSDMLRARETRFSYRAKRMRQ